MKWIVLVVVLSGLVFSCDGSKPGCATTPPTDEKEGRHWDAVGEVEGMKEDTQLES